MEGKRAGRRKEVREGGRRKGKESTPLTKFHKPSLVTSCLPDTPSILSPSAAGPGLLHPAPGSLHLLSPQPASLSNLPTAILKFKYHFIKRQLPRRTPPHRHRRKSSLQSPYHSQKLLAYCQIPTPGGQNDRLRPSCAHLSPPWHSAQNLTHTDDQDT